MKRTIRFMTFYCVILNGYFSSGKPAENLEDLTGDCGKLWEIRDRHFKEFMLAADYAAHVATQENKLSYWDVTVDVLKGTLMDCRFPRYKITAVFAPSNCSTKMSWEALDKAVCSPQPGKPTKTCNVFIWVPPGKGGKLQTYNCTENHSSGTTKTIQTAELATSAKEHSSVTENNAKHSTAHLRTTEATTQTTRLEDKHHDTTTLHLENLYQSDSSEKAHPSTDETKHGSSTPIALIGCACVLSVAGFALYTHRVLKAY